ncbi:MAG: hypothetical protein KGJ23_08475 [Euryarchaeota archaeon]|nr:hypothetical protein [Euryarchaeota archaeon]MDE1836637.1 hypothetical protein [Euryarchaeota archaeon]MDE1879168.1 hypothetical protein [Euryarchaeota archaeon]MDE2044607.1 hypothetical protein [Thermoplasmata archaeon]
MSEPVPLTAETAKVGQRVWTPRSTASAERIVGVLVIVEPSRLVVLADGPDTLPRQARIFERWNLPVYACQEEP